MSKAYETGQQRMAKFDATRGIKKKDALKIVMQHVSCYT
jgi:hypothetical protein